MSPSPPATLLLRVATAGAVLAVWGGLLLFITSARQMDVTQCGQGASRHLRALLPQPRSAPPRSKIVYVAAKKI